jgi:hypothetical protein
MSGQGTRTRRIIWFMNCGLFAVILAVGGAFVTASAQESKPPDRWEAYKFLLGEWVGEGAGQPGQGEGGSTFTLDLNDNILVRKNYNKIPATKDRPAVDHEDLMIIFQPPQKPACAVYWDNEGHMINYTAEFSADGKTLTFVSDIIPEAPRFKLSYVKLAPDSLKISFEFAPPGKPDAFSPYTTGVVHKK